jgi:dolichol-phosphate mannosyltransferase
VNDRESRPLVSIVCPVFNEESTVELFYERLTAVLRDLTERYRFELIFANNASTDDTAARVGKLREANGAVQLLTLSRNYGYQYNVLAGMRQASGAAIIVIDVDCEDPPELIPQLLAGWDEGNDVVYGERDRRQEPLHITAMRKLFYRLNKRVADSDIILDMAEFFLVTAEVRDAVASTRNTFPFLRAEVAHYGFRRKGIRYDRQQRVAGETHYNLWGMVVFAVAGILASTTLPLRLGLFLLPALIGINVALLGAELQDKPHAFEALVAIDFLYVATALALASLYISRIYRNVIGRPIAVDWRASAVNLEKERSANYIAPRAQPVDAHELPSLFD